MRADGFTRAIVVCSLVLGCLCLPGYAGEADDRVLTDDRLVSANTRFGFKLFEKLLRREPGGNILISPVSLAMALEMTYNGARGGTMEAMAGTLELEGMTLEEVNRANAALTAALEELDDDVRLDMANSLWVRRDLPVEEDFMERNEDFYRADVRSLEFDDPLAPGIINAWIGERTRGRIESIVEEIRRDDLLFLLNAVSFRGGWMVKFDKLYTRERAFNLGDGGVKNVPLMMSRSDLFKWFRGDDFQAVALPYGDGRTSMYIFLPDRDSSLAEFREQLNAGNWEEWMSRFRAHDVIVGLPRFKLEYGTGLNEVLEELGMGVAFGPGADFKGICPGGSFIGEVKHKTFVQVDEEGTEAAAAVSVRISKGGAPYFIADRPFFFAVRDDWTGSVLFMGRVVEP